MNSNCAAKNCTITNRNTTMDTKTLRQKILDLAIRGKLVPQDPNDEPASVLLERIKAEKERLIKEGKIKRSKKLAKTSDTPHYENVPFEVPEGWAWTNIEELFFVTKLAGFEYTDYLTKYTISSNNEVPIVRAQNVRMGYFVENTNEAISEVLSQQLERSALTKKCLLMTFIGAGIGDTCIFPALKRCHLAPNVAKIEPYSSKMDLKYALYYLMSDLGQLGVRGISKSTAQPSLSMATIRSLEVPLPPLAEQSYIVAEIEKWFELIAQIEQEKSDLQTIIKQTKSKILDLAIHGKLVPQDPNDEPAIELLKRINPGFIPCDNGHSEKFPYEIPETWIWCGHNSILDISGGAQPAKSYFETQPKPNYIRLYQIRDYGESPIPVYIPINLASKQTEKGDILLARYGGSLGKVFHAEQGAYNVAMAKVIFKFENLIYKEFAYYYYLSDLYQGKLKEISRTAQAGFNSTDFNDMYFPLPPINEQQRIVQKIETLFSVLDNIQTTLEV